MLAGEAFYAFQVDCQRALHQDVSEVFADRLALVDDCERSLRGHGNAAQSKLSQQGALVHFLKEPGAQCVGDLEDRRQDAIRQRFQKCYSSAFIAPSPVSSASGRRSRSTRWLLTRTTGLTNGCGARRQLPQDTGRATI